MQSCCNCCYCLIDLLIAILVAVPVQHHTILYFEYIISILTRVSVLILAKSIYYEVNNTLTWARLGSKCIVAT